MTAVESQAQASGSSFYAAMRLLPKAEREAMFAIYAFCREVDDIADEPGPTIDERRALLDGWRRDVRALHVGSAARRMGDLVEPVRRFGLAEADFLAVIDGMEMDVGEGIRAPPFATLDLYCDRVASAVGRLSVRVFGMAPAPGRELAHHLGRALQFTNILRDLDEDAAAGRLYLPAEALAAAGIEAREPEEVLTQPGIDRACRWLAAQAHEHYRAADRIVGARPEGRLRPPRLMSGAYGAILRRMEATGWAPPRRRVGLGKGALTWIVLTRGLAR
ncbi:MAG: presqualene diphosphate synthase HpnD [Caulobacteraceae bacterium]|nr:presqualene diphosphate synthase HpnD [Caulobacteraceae bacterium]